MGSLAPKSRVARVRKRAGLSFSPNEVLVVENDVEKRTMNLQCITGVIINEPQFPKPVHEKANPRASCTYHLP